MARRVYTPTDIEWWQARAEHLEERLAEVEAERDGVYGELEMWQEKAADTQRDLSEALARLAAVEAVCDEGIDHPGTVAPSAETRFWLRDVRAIARGEGDRPAEGRSHCGHYDTNIHGDRCCVCDRPHEWGDTDCPGGNDA